MTEPARVLVVDDDAHIRHVVRFALEQAGFVADEAADGRAALARIAAQPPDLLVLDIMMPELDGTEVCRQVRARSRLPIIFLSSRDDEVDRIVGLELGGDDYVTKPFSPRELVARVRAVLRRAQPQPTTAEPAQPKLMCRGALRLDLDAHTVTWHERAIVLTVTEFGIVR